MTVEVLSEPVREPFPDEWYSTNSFDHFWFRWRHIALRRLIRDAGLDRRSPLRVMDLGCGSGVVRQRLEDETAWSVDAVDLTPETLRDVPPGRGRILCYNVLDRRPGLVGTYDAIAMLDVLEHIRDTGPFVRAVVAHLKPGGTLLVNVPGMMAAYSDYDRLVGHHRRYSPRTLAREFAGTGLRVVSARWWGVSLAALVLLRKRLVTQARAGTEVVRRGMVPPNVWVHAGLKAAMAVETGVVRRPAFGSSVMMALSAGA